MGKNSLIKVNNADGTTSTIDLTELAAIDSISAADLAKIDGITNGTQAAGKAVVADANVNTGISKITELHIGTSGSETQVTATGAELNYNDITTLGTGAASKAIVLDSGGDYNMPDGGMFNKSADALAAAGSTQADAAAITDQINIVTGADGVKGVALLAAADLGEYTITNDSPTYALKVYTVNSGDDVINELGATDPFLLGAGRTATFKATSATQFYVDKEASRPHRATHFEVFDDFLDASIDTTNDWIVFAGTDADATAAATVAGTPEGQILMGSGDANGVQDGSVLSLILLSQGSLVSLGTTTFECRVSFSQLAGVAANFGLSDTLATDAERLLHTVDSGTVADGGLTVTNTAEFAFSSDATATDKWQYASENAGTIGNSAAEEASASGPTANTFDILRIEIDADGTARYYLNGALETTRATAVATTSLLIPYIGIDSGTDAQTVTDLTIDYIYFSGARPSSNA
jgi:hypothetical protein